jgi:putative membrane protein
MYQSLARPLAIVGAIALLAACGQKNATQQPDANPAATIPTPANEASAADFVPKAAASDMFEIQAAQVALKASKNAEVKTFAQMMIDAHTKSTNDLKAAIAASALSLAPPATLPADLQNKIDALNSADASGFDKTYIDQQVDAHQSALDLIQRYANDGDTPAIKTFAATAAPIVQDHLTKARDLQGKIK